ncbi:unnamed protein product [Prorocentrum cordatum]|uniref:RNase H type-1 domain-containing protein n=1 Tax=Prorocentrum cordatum TaxID=2364126 RepID=A0ABN9P616_9DINO|nr:unnamed protein product [Polarella glacialis]
MAWRTERRLCKAARPPRGAGTIGEAIDKAKAKAKAKGKAKAEAKRVRFASDVPGPAAAAATPAPWALGAAKQAAEEQPSGSGGKDEEVRQDFGALVPVVDAPPPAKPFAELSLQALLAREAKIKGQVGRAEIAPAAVKEEQEAVAARVAEQADVLQKRRDQLEEVAEAVRARKRADLAQHTGPSPMEEGEPEEAEGCLGKALLKGLEGLEAERERVLLLGEEGGALLAMAAEARSLAEKLAAADARAREAAAAERARATAAAAERAAAAQEAAPEADGGDDGAAGPPWDRKRVGDLDLGPELVGLDAVFGELGMGDEQQRAAWRAALAKRQREHRLKGKQAVARAAGWMQARGFSWHGQAALPTGPGPLESSGGVAVATLRPSAAAAAPGPPAHRFQVCEVNLGFREPCRVISAYFITKVGRAKENIGLLAALHEFVGQLESPWIVMGDWNMEPEDVREWARSAGGALVAPEEPTCGSKVFDFAVASKVLTGFVDAAEVLLRAPTKDHVPSKVVLRGVGPAAKVQRPLFPAAFPLPLPPPVRPAPLERAFSTWSPGGGQSLKVGCQEWFEAAGAYLIDLREIAPPSRWKGRAGGLRAQRVEMEVAWQQGLKRSVGAACRRWMSFAAACARWRALQEAAPGGRCWAPLRKQREVLMAFELERPEEGPLAGLSVARVVGLLSSSSCQLTVQFVQGEARRRWRLDKQQKAAEWRTWAQAAATEKGGSAAHRFIKQVAAAPAVVLAGADGGDDPRMPVAGEAAVAALLEARQPLWIKPSRAGEAAPEDWGVQESELPPLELEDLERVLGTYREGLPMGASVGLRLRALHGAAYRDPFAVHAVEVARSSGVTLETGLPSAAVVQECWLGAQGLLDLRRPWGQRRDPAQACVLALRRVGIDMVAYNAVIDWQARVLSLELYSPGMLVQVVRESAMLASDVLALKRLRGPGAWAWPVHWKGLERLLHARRRPEGQADAEAADGAGRLVPAPPPPHWQARHRRALVAVLGGSHWPQERLWKEGKARDGLCRLCGGRGTLRHRAFECDAWLPLRRDACSPELLEGARLVAQRGDAAAELFARALCPDPALAFPAAADAALAAPRWFGVPPGSKFAGRVFVDGSARFPALRGARRAGWAVVQIGLSRGVIGGMHGIVPRAYGPEQEARDGEDYAFHMLAQFWLPSAGGSGLEVFCDCAGAVGLALSQGKALAPLQARRHLWQEWWAGPGPSATVRKVKAHTVLAAASWEDELLIRGNRAADLWAKRGAALWPIDEERVWFLQACAWRVEELGRWVGELAATMVDREQLDSDGVVGTADLVYDIPQAALDAAELADAEVAALALEADLELGQAPGAAAGAAAGVELGQATAAAAGAAADELAEAAVAAPELKAAAAGAGVARVVRGHCIVVSRLVNGDGAMAWCLKCGCRFWKRSPPAGTGLLGSCKGRPAPGERAAEARRLLMRLQEPKSRARLFAPQPPTEEEQARLAAVLHGDAGAVDGAGAPAGAGRSPRWGLRPATADAWQAAELHGFASPAAAARWARARVAAGRESPFGDGEGAV